MPGATYLLVNLTFTINHVLSVLVGERDERGDDGPAGSIRDVVLRDHGRSGWSAVRRSPSVSSR